MKRNIFTMSVAVLIFAFIGLCICLWKLYVFEKGSFILVGGISLALIVATYLNIVMKYCLDQKR